VKMTSSFLSVPDWNPPGGDVYAPAPSNGIACGRPRSRGMQTHSQIDVACDTLCVNLTAKLLHVVRRFHHRFSFAARRSLLLTHMRYRGVDAKPRTGCQQGMVPEG
jgi:hypothetical protein